MRSDSMKVAAVPEYEPRIELGMPILRIVCSIMAAASLRACPGFRLKEMVLDTNRP